MTRLSPLLPADAGTDANAAYQRADARNNMFVTAVLYGERGSAPVRIRNMSRSGALIESADLPPETAKVRLSRGSLSVRGEIVWHREDRVGIRFDTPVEVADWLPRGSRPTGQQHVDEMVHACRSSSGPRPGSGGPAAATTRPEAIRQLIDVKDSLAAAASELAGDPAIAVAHPTALQAIDVAAQKLERLAALLADRS